jgi:hypothetical protein
MGLIMSTRRGARQLGFALLRKSAISTPFCCHLAFRPPQPVGLVPASLRFDDIDGNRDVRLEQLVIFVPAQPRMNEPTAAPMSSWFFIRRPAARLLVRRVGGGGPRCSSRVQIT